MPPLLVATDVTVRPIDAPTAILSDFSLTLSTGDLVLLIGDSGSGKTTALRSLNGLSPVTSGSIQLDGREILTLEPRELRRRVGMIPQTPFMFEGTVNANLQVAARYSGRELADADRIDVMHRAGLAPELADRVAVSLSIGQQQRVAIARVLVGQPEIILCDEPTSALDETMTLRLEETIMQLQSAGTAVVFVTHDMQQAARLGGRMIRLIDGETVATEQARR